MRPDLPAARRIRYFLLGLSGLMLGCSFPPLPSGSLAAFAFVPFFIAFEDLETHGKAFRASYLAFFIFNLIAISWTGGFVHGKDPYLMAAGAALVFGHPLFMYVPVLLFTMVRKYFDFKTAVFAFPFMWVGFEYLHTITEFGFPWLVLGNTQTYDLPAIQFASASGVYGVSFWLLWINVIAYVLYAKLALKEWKPFSRHSIVLVAGIVVLYVLPKIYGNVIMAQADKIPQEKSVRIGIIQPDIDPFEKWQGGSHEQISVYQQLMEGVAQQRLDLIVWPETATPFYLFAPQNQSVFQRIRKQIDSLRLPLLTGISDIVYYRETDIIPKGSKVIASTGQRYETFNSSMLLHPFSSEIQKHAKMILVPFAERTPYSEYFPFSSVLQWSFGLGGWGIGTDSMVFRLRLADSSEVRFSNLICYESVYPGFVASFVRRGAEFLTIITNDSWWGNTFGAYQHQRYAVLRAVENRRWIARCANGGISCFIDPYGNVYQPTAMFTKAALVGEIQARGDMTFYATYGDMFAQICFLVSGVFLASTFGKKFYLRHRLRGRR